jgi:hypothetical protein
MKISICIPSYKRPKVETLDYIPWAKVFVDESEAGEYAKANKGAEIIALAKGIQGNLCRVRNHILDTELPKADCVVILDDDMRGIFYHEGGERIKIQTESFKKWIALKTETAFEFGAKLWGVNINPDYLGYREYAPIGTTSFIGGPFGCFLSGFNCRYDEALPLKEDYDITIQCLKKYRIAVRFNKYHYDVKQSKQAGGCAAYRNAKFEMEQLVALQKKWGSKIVRFDGNENSASKKKRAILDYNPIIKVPIKGI